MADTLRLAVLTPSGSVIEADAGEVVIPGAEGEFGVLPAHTPYLALLSAGLVSFTRAGKRDSVAVRRGLAEVSDDRVIILTTEALRPGDLDSDELERRAAESLRRLEEALALGEDAVAAREENAFYAALKTAGSTGAGAPRR